MAIEAEIRDSRGEVASLTTKVSVDIAEDTKWFTILENRKAGILEDLTEQEKLEANFLLWQNYQFIASQANAAAKAKQTNAADAIAVNRFIITEAFNDIRLIPFDTTEQRYELVLRYMVSAIEKISAYPAYIEFEPIFEEIDG